MEPLVDVRPGIVGVAVRRRWRTLVISLLIGGLAAIALLAARGPTYTATAVVLLKPLPGNPYSPTSSPGRAEELTSLETEAALVGTQTVANRAIPASGGRLGRGSADQVSVAVPSNSKILRISFAAKSPDVARIGAQAFADAYLAYRHEQAEKSASEQIDQLTRQIRVTRSEQDAASKKLADEPDGSPSIPALQQEVQTYASQIAQLRVQLAGIEDASNAPGDVITPARPPSQPDGLPPWLIATGVVLIAGGIGLLVALWREHSDDRIRDADDIAALGGGRLVATVTSTSVETLLDQPVREGYRMLRSSAVRHLGDSSSVIAIAPVGANVDASGVAFGLAAALERSRRRTILVITDADPAQPYHWWTDGRGLSDLLQHPEHVRDQLPLALHEVRPGLLVLGPGRDAAEMIDRYQSADMVAILEQLRAAAEVVVVAPPPMTTGAGRALADFADVMFFAVALDHSRHAELVEAAEEMSLHRATVVGTLAVTPGKRKWRGNWFGRSRKRQSPVAHPLPALPEPPPPVRTSAGVPPTAPDPRGGEADPPTIPISTPQPDGAERPRRKDKAAGTSPTRERTRRQSASADPADDGSDRVTALIRDYSARPEEKS
jgi:Mrp family chromosome partitioning ATPase/capsular polysaccharide biosynthesis protein